MSAMNFVDEIMETIDQFRDLEMIEPTIDELEMEDMKELEEEELEFEEGGEIESGFFKKIAAKLYQNEEMSDVYFKFLSGKRIPAQKLIMAMGSKVFFNLFKNNNEKTEIEIHGYSYEAFKEFLQFFYTDDVHLTMKNVDEVLCLCKKYKMENCVDVCVEFMKPNLDTENVIWAYELAIKNNIEELKERCERIINSSSEAVFASDGFKTCNRDTLASILEIKDPLYLEIDLFEACMSWVKSVSKQNEVTKASIDDYMGDLFYKIQYGTMQLNEVSQLIVKYGHIFTRTDYRKILSVFMPTEPQSENKEPEETIISLPENGILRCIRRNNAREYTENRPVYYLKNIENTTFVSDTRFLLVAFEPSFIFKHEIGKESEIDPAIDEMPTKITIIEKNPNDNREKIVLQNENGIFKNRKQTMRMNIIKLTKSILIKPKFIYTIRMEQSPPENCACEYTDNRMGRIDNARIEFRQENALLEVDGYKSVIDELQFIGVRS